MPKPKYVSYRKALIAYNNSILKFFTKLFKLSISLCFFSPILSAQTDNWETGLLRNIEDHRTTGKTSFYKGISASTYLLSIAVPASYLVTGMIKDDKYLKKTALYLTETIVISQVISFSTKAIVNRPRPAVKDPTLTAIHKSRTTSFPSGHTAAAFSIATALTISNPKWYVMAPTFTWATLVGYSRLYLGVHYPSDILAGALVGSGSAWLNYRLNKWMHKSKTRNLKEVPVL